MLIFVFFRLSVFVFVISCNVAILEGAIVVYLTFPNRSICNFLGFSNL